jgi:hypothetical protein
VSEQTRECTKCHQVKPLDAFYGGRGKCKKCVSAYNRERYRTVTGKDYVYDWSSRKRYGVSLEEYEEMLRAQDGRCAICGDPPGKRRLAIDHCHETGRVRGLLCVRCNTLIGQADDSVERLRQAVLYLRRHRVETPV